MLYAILICSDDNCGEEFEAWGEPGDFDAMACDRCGCVLEPLGYCEVSRATVARLPRRLPYVQLRRAA